MVIASHRSSLSPDTCTVEVCAGEGTRTPLTYRTVAVVVGAVGPEENEVVDSSRMNVEWEPQRVRVQMR